MATKEAALTLKAGDVIAQRYEIARELGRGGMGVVYLCTDRVTGDRVAAKCVFLDKSKGVASEAIWFEQEARALAALDHPTIVRPRDYGALPDGSPFLVMDALHGRSIHVWKYLTKLPWPVIWSVVDQVLAGLAHAHARGVIHGDLKPSNVLIDPRGGVEDPRTYVLDLGLAWLMNDHVDPRLGESQLAAPTMPFGLGTPGWMAPEQIRRAAPHIGPATDLYALGSIVFELLSGREVFSGTGQEILRAHRDTPVTEVSPLPPGAPAEAGAWTVRCLAKRPWDRFRLAADARAAWAPLRPEGEIRWDAPNVRVGDEDESPISLRPVPSASNPSAALAPGLLALRPTPLVGRKRERAELDARVGAIVRGEQRQHLVLLRGEAGVGKSRLAEWLQEHVHETGAMIPLRARYRRTPGPFDGMRGAITTHFNLRGVARDVIEQALLNEWEVEPSDEQGRTWVAAAAAWLKPLSADEEARVGPSGKRFFLDKAELRWVVIRHVLERVAATGRPLLLWVDDLHLASPNTFAGLTALHRDAKELPLLYLATVRDEALAADPAASRRVKELLEAIPSTTLSVAPLDDEETRALLAASLPLAEDAEATAVMRSHGNPLYALQLVHSWASSGQLSLDGGAYRVPAAALARAAKTTAELFDERMAALPAQLRPAAFAAAALGEVLHAEGLGRMLQSMGLEVRPTLRALQEAQVLLVSRSGRLRWPHALLQEHVLARLAEQPDAKKIHRLAADALATYPDAGSRRIVRQRAANLQRAGDDAQAARLVLDFVAHAWRRAREVGWIKRDLEVLDGRVHGELLGEQLRWRAEVERHMGELTQARRDAEEARRLLSALGRQQDEAHCLRLLAHIASDQGVPALGRIEALLAHATFVQIGDDHGRAQVEVLLGEIEYLLGDHASARLHLGNAALTLRKAGDTLVLAQCYILLSLVEQAVGRLEPARELLTLARAEFDAIGYQLGLAQTDVVLGHVEHRAFEFDAAYARARETRQRFVGMATPRGEAACERLLAMASLDRGDTAAALRHALAAYAVFDERLADPWGRVEASLLLAQVALAEGSVDRAREHLDAARAIELDESEPTQHRHLTSAWLALAEADHARAEEELGMARTAFPDRRRTGDHTPALLVRLATLAAGTSAAEVIDEWQRFLAAAPALSTPVPPPP